MNQSVLKKIRVVFSILYLILITCLFVDFTGLIPSSVYKSITFLQFLPSLLQFKALFTISSIGFIVVIVLTVFFGRVYCSFICPLGILQDIISFITKKIRRLKQYRYKYLKSFSFIRYSFLGLFIAGLLSGYTLILSILDPYSIYGRIASGVFRKSIVETNNLVVSGLQQINVYSLYHVDLKPEYWTILAVSLFFLLIIILFSAFRGRLYCNTICPVGAFLGLISKFSVFKIELDKNSCTGCHLCVRSCKAGCIDCETKQIDTERCVACFNCLTVCKENGIHYKLSSRKELTKGEPIPVNTGSNRRQFIAITALILAAGVKKLKAQHEVKDTATKPTGRDIPVSPPGSKSVDQFNSSCTACHLCISVCPTHVLQPSYTDYGLIGFMQPVMDYKAGFCNYECKKCTEICPTGAIKPIELENKKLTQIGIAHFVRRNCIVRTERTDCGACAEHCPTKAVTMVPWRDGLVIPEVTPEICIGCGACEYACPTTPYKAIYVEGNAEHAMAGEPDKQKQNIIVEDDFPF